MARDKSKILIWVVVVLFAMNFLPGEGFKAADQQALVITDYSCGTSSDCPTCVGGFLASDEPDPQNNFLDELGHAACVQGQCELTEYCLVWDCGGAANCNSVKQTLLDNTFGRINNNPLLMAGLVGLLVVWLLL